MGTRGSWRRGAAFACTLVGLAGAAWPQDLRELVKGARESVVLLRVFGPGQQEFGQGTAFVVRDGVLATNHHVIDRAARIEAVLASEATVAVEGLIASDPGNDLALLRIPAGSLPPLPIATAAVEPGERVVVLGNPLGLLAGSVSEGIVAAVRREGLDVDDPRYRNRSLLQITAPISQGSSGSPVMNLRGEVVGVAVSTFVFGQNLNLAVPGDLLADLVARADPTRLAQEYAAPAGALGSPAYLRNLGISALIFAAIYFGLRRLR